MRAEAFDRRAVWNPPPRPEWLARLNAEGKILDIENIVPLAEDSLLAAARAGIQTVVLPRRNQKDLVDVGPEIREKLEIQLADTIEEVLAIALESPAGEGGLPQS